MDFMILLYDFNMTILNSLHDFANTLVHSYYYDDAILICFCYCYIRIPLIIYEQLGLEFLKLSIP